MNKLSIEKRSQIIGMLVEGNSMRAITCMTGCSINTVTKLLVDVGSACWVYQDNIMRNLSCENIQCDEIWNFCYCKEKNIPEGHKGEFGYGDVYTWTAMDADTKLIPSFLVGRRDAACAKVFMKDLADRLKNKVQLTTDGHRAYLTAVEDAFGGDIDYAMLVKVYGEDQSTEGKRRYSPAECTGTEIMRISGNPDEKDISTSFVERQNLTMCMSMRRFTRLTNGFSKKIENLEYSVALHFMHYNFCRVHKTLRVTPAMEARITDKVWEVEDILKMIK